MSAKVSRMVSDRVSITHTVASAVVIHGPEAAPELEKTLFPDGPPPGGITVAAVLDALGGLLTRRTAALVAADRTHAVELADDDEHRAKRDERITDLRGYLSSLRANLTGNYGPGLSVAYGLPAAIPDDAASLLTLAGSVEHLLRNRPLTEPPKRHSLAIDPVATADDLQAAAAELQASLGDVEREKREAQLTLNAKNEALAEWTSGYQGVADAVSALFYLAGKRELAEKVRPTARRRAGLPEAGDTPPVEPPPPAPPPV